MTGLETEVAAKVFALPAAPGSVQACIAITVIGIMVRLMASSRRLCWMSPVRTQHARPGPTPVGSMDWLQMCIDIAFPCMHL